MRLHESRHLGEQGAVINSLPGVVLGQPFAEATADRLKGFSLLPASHPVTGSRSPAKATKGETNWRHDPISSAAPAATEEQQDIRRDVKDGVATIIQHLGIPAGAAMRWPRRCPFCLSGAAE